jgi:endoglucanase
MRFLFCIIVLVAHLAFQCQSFADDRSSMHANGGFELDQDSDEWPDHWPKVTDGFWIHEEGNHFLRLVSPEPGKMIMLYDEIRVPDDVRALKLSWKQRVIGLKVGKNSWFDARIMLDFLDASRNKLSPTPPALATNRDTKGWVSKSTEFLVPEGTHVLKFMPSLFQVNTGTFDLDDISLESIDPAPLRTAMVAKEAEKRAKLAAETSKRQGKASAALAQFGTLITNGDFQLQSKNSAWPEGWGRPKSGSWEQEGSNRFLRLTSPAAGELVTVYRTADLPADTQALELTWEHRVTGLKKGELPWHDARIMLDFLDATGKKIAQPSPAYQQKDTDGWTKVTKSFLVPEGAATLALMPSLFQVRAGTYDLDNITLRPTDPAPLLTAAIQREKEIKARYVAPEAPERASWPLEIKVVGNRLHDTQGREVWLQGVNAGGLETLPHDRQMIKSVVVAIDQWKAKCVRIPMNETFWYGKSPYQKDDGKEYREIIDQIITLAANRGAYVVIDLHRYRAPRREHANFWIDFATQYKNHPAVLFDLLNEPHDISWDVWKNGGFIKEPNAPDESAFLTAEEKQENIGFESIGMQAMVDAVRSTGAKNIVIAGGIFWCNDLSGISRGYALEDNVGNGIVYSWHTYHWHKDWEGKVLATAKLHPVLLGEVGADIQKMSFIPLEDQEDPYTWVPDMLGFIQKHRLNWTGWCFHPKATPVMISDWSYTPTPFWGQFAKDALSGKQFELKRTR